MRTNLSRTLAVLVGLVISAVFAAPAFAGGNTDPGTGYIEVCKTTTVPGSVTGAFSIQVDGVGSWTVNVGECTAPILVSAGSVTVHEENLVDSHGFATNDYTLVSAIHTSQPGALDDALVSKNLATRTATVTVTAGDQSKDTIVTFTNDPVQGYFEICKTQVLGAGLDNQTFSYLVNGAMGWTQTINVLVGACSNPFYAPAGHVDIAELGDAAFVTAISSVPPDRLLASNLDLGTASLKIVPAATGFVSNESIVTFTNNSAQLKICKVAGDEALLEQHYAFVANGANYSVTAGPDGGHCVLAGRYRAGTVVSVKELPTAGQKVDTIVISPADRTFVHSGNDFTGQVATFTIGSGTTILTYTNVIADPGWLKICKLSSDVTGTATFTIAGPRGTAPAITQGSDTVTVPIGQCSLLEGPYPFAGIQTITETPVAGVAVSAIAVLDADRLAAGPDLAAGSVGAFIGDGTTVATFTNADPPVAVTPSGSTVPFTPTVAATPPAAVAPFVTAPATKQVAAAAKLSTVKIITVLGKRYVAVKVSSPNGIAKIHLRLVDKHGTVVKNVVRSVKTNALVRIPNLTLTKSVVKVRANVLG